MELVTTRKRSLGQGNIFIGVCQEFCSRGVPAPGGCVSAPGGVPGPRGVSAPRGVPRPRRECLVPGGCLLRGEGVCSRGGGAWWRPPRTATAAGGTHPTGMHSCCRHIFTVQCNLFTMHTFLYNLFTVTGKNNTMYSKNRIGNTNFHSKLPIFVFQINSITLIESDKFRETSNNVYSGLAPIITETHFTL